VLIALLKNLRVGLLAAWAVGWNVLLRTGMYLDRGLAREQSFHFGWMFSVATIGTSCLSLLSLWAPRFQRVTLRKGSRVAPIRGPLLFVAAFTGAMGIATLLSSAMQP
jgi:hypothetical protein